MFNVLDLFSGIGGFSLGLERAGMRTVAFCEIDPYCRAVLRKHWPGVPIFEDVRTLTAEQVGPVDLICGGFPCQDISSAGKKAGIDGDKSGLWKEYFRLIRAIRPRRVIVENVAALLARGLERVLGDLAQIGYDAEWHCIPASRLGANHQRDRIWIIAYPHTDSMRLQGVWSAPGASWSEQQFEGLVQVALRDAIPTRGGRGIHDGARNRAHRLRALGNAVVPQIPEIIGRAIIAAHG